MSAETEVASATTMEVRLPDPVGSANPDALATTAPEYPDTFLNRHLGFSADDAYLGYEIAPCDPCTGDFHFTSPTKPALDFGYYNNQRAWSAAEEKKQNADVERRLKEMGVTKGPQKVLRGPFPFPDLVFASKTDRNDVKGTVSLLFGARVSGYAPVYPMRIDLGPGPLFGMKMETSDRLLGDPFLAYANVTKDGSDIGIVAVATGTMWYETADVARMSARAFAGQVYNDTGMRLHQSKRYAQAAALFEKAEIASPADSLFSYNLACARARLSDPRAEEALRRAIQHGGDAVKARATLDADFMAVGGQPWFKELVR